jgi:hypothetical protein
MLKSSETDKKIYKLNNVKNNFDMLEKPNIRKAFREMMSITILLPGQETPVHYDNPYFMEISRETAPVWLLVALKQSEILAQEEVHQLQGVAYMNGFEINFDIKIF